MICIFYICKKYIVQAKEWMLYANNFHKFKTNTRLAEHFLAKQNFSLLSVALLSNGNLINIFISPKVK